MAKALLKVPSTANKGEVITLRVLIQHPMETGHRRDAEGNAVPRDIISLFTCHYNGDEIFRADLFPAVAAYPLFQFTTVAVSSGSLTFTWTDETGKSWKETADITVAG